MCPTSNNTAIAANRLLDLRMDGSVQLLLRSEENKVKGQNAVQKSSSPTFSMNPIYK